MIWMYISAKKAGMGDVKNNVIAIPINSRDRTSIDASTTNFTIRLKKSLRNISALSVTDVVIPRSDTIISANNSRLSGTLTIDDIDSLWTIQIPYGNYDAASLTTALEAAFADNIIMASYSITWAVMYDTASRRIRIIITYPNGINKSWLVRINYTPLRDMIGVGNGGTTTRIFAASPGSSTLNVICGRSPAINYPLCLNVTSARLTNSINTSFTTSLGKVFNVTSANNTLVLAGSIVADSHTTQLSPPQNASINTVGFGRAVALSADGLYMLVGSSGYGSYPFSRPTTQADWVQMQDTPFRDLSYAQSVQGAYVALSADGLFAAAVASARVYIYVRSAGKWRQQTIISCPTVVTPRVELNIDGSVLAVVDQSGSTETYIYTRTRATWSLSATLTNTATFGANGMSLSLSGNILVLGSRFIAAPVKALVYTRANDVWSPQYIETDGTNAGAGYYIQNVAVSPDGSRIILIGASQDAMPAITWVYSFSDSAWVEEQQLMVQGAACGAFDADASSIVFGLPTTRSGAGSISIWRRIGTTWTEDGARYDPDTQGQARQGTDVALSANGAAIVFTAPGGLGSVLTLNDSQLLTKTISRGGGVINRFGEMIAMSEDGNTMAAGFSSFTRGDSVGHICIYVSNGLDWIIEAEISPVTDNGLPKNARIGYRVAISADGNTLTFVGQNANTVWVYVRDVLSRVWSQKAAIDVSASPNPFNSGSEIAINAAGTMIVGAGRGVSGVLVILSTHSDIWAVESLNVGLGAWGNNNITSIDISADSTRIIAGAADRAIVLTRTVASWSFSVNLDTYAPGFTTSGFGERVAISADGLTAAVSSPGEAATYNGTSYEGGATYIFRASGSAWALMQRVVGTVSDEVVSLRQGTSLALMNNGASCLVGSKADVVSGIAGSVWRFDLSGDTWSQVSRDLGGGAYFGASISAQKLGQKYMVGAPGNTDGGGIDRVGLVFEYSPAGTIYPNKNTVPVPIGGFSIYELINVLNSQLADIIAAGAGYRLVLSDDAAYVTISAVIGGILSGSTFSALRASTFDVIRWLGIRPGPSQKSSVIDFSINNDSVKRIVARDSDGIIVDSSSSSIYRKYPAGYTIGQGELVDIQLRDDRDQIVDLNGADWVMTVLATVRA